MSESSLRSLYFAAIWMTVSVMCFLVMLYRPFPPVVSRFFVFALGPSIVVSSLAIHRAFREAHSRLLLDIATGFFVCAAVMVTSMVVLEHASAAFIEKALVDLRKDPHAIFSVERLREGASGLQMAFDFAWNLFFSLAAMSLCVVIFGHASSGRALPITGFALAALLLIRDFFSFPNQALFISEIPLAPLLGGLYLLLALRWMWWTQGSIRQLLREIK